MSNKVNALTYRPPPAVMRIGTFERRRLGIMDEVALAELLFDSLGSMDFDPEKIEDLSVGEAIGLLVVLFRKEEVIDKLLGFLRSVLVDFPLSVEEMKDPEKFPIGSTEAIIESLANDKDVEAFFGSVQRLWKLKGKLKGTRSPKKSTSSKKGTAGQTKK